MTDQAHSPLFQLTELILDEISLVDRPANPLASVILFKRDSTKETDMTDEQKMAEAVAKAAEAVAALAALTTERDFLKTALDAQTPKLAAAEAELTTLKATLKKDEPAPKLPPEAQAQIDKALADAAEATTELAKMRDDRDTLVFVGKASVLKALPQQPAEFGLVLKRIAQNKATPEIGRAHV